MSENPDDNSTNRAGRGMIIFAWVGALALLTLLFQDILQSRFNPNTQPLVVEGEDGSKEVVLERNAKGHYVATGAINGLPVIFLLDTGATDVALPETLADRLRLPRLSGGVSQTRLDSVQLGAITLTDVRAAIVPSMGAGDPVLLGMSFLRQLDFTQRDGQLTLSL